MEKKKEKPLCRFYVCASWLRSGFSVTPRFLSSESKQNHFSLFNLSAPSHVASSQAKGRSTRLHGRRDCSIWTAQDSCAHGEIVRATHAGRCTMQSERGWRHTGSMHSESVGSHPHL